jgi:tetratricopeptide (TPR) repeat protein
VGRTFLGVLTLAALLAAARPLHKSLLALQETYPSEFRAYYVPQSSYVKVLSLGQRNFWADLIFIWDVQYFDRYATSVRDEYLFHTFDVITDLDPHFDEAYIFGNLFLSLDNSWDLLYRLSDKGLAENPGDWVLAWDAGTYAFFQAKNYDKAHAYFSFAHEKNPANALIKDMVANSLKYKGDYEKSLAFWQKIAGQFEQDDSTRGRYFFFAATRNIFDLTIKIDLKTLRDAVSRYRAERGSLPKSLDDLVTAGLLKRLPLDPEGKAYAYDPKTGEVTCVTPFRFRGKFAKW